MAFWDFLQQPVGGYNASPGPHGGEGLEYGPSSTDTLYPASNMTWGQFMQMLGSTSSGSGQSFNGAVSNPFAPYMQQGQPGMAQPQIYKIGPTADYNRPEPAKDNTGIMEVMQIAGMFFGA